MPAVTMISPRLDYIGCDGFVFDFWMIAHGYLGVGLFAGYWGDGIHRAIDRAVPLEKIELSTFRPDAARAFVEEFMQDLCTDFEQQTDRSMPEKVLSALVYRSDKLAQVIVLASGCAGESHCVTVTSRALEALRSHLREKAILEERMVDRLVHGDSTGNPKRPA